VRSIPAVVNQKAGEEERVQLGEAVVVQLDEEEVLLDEEGVQLDEEEVLLGEALVLGQVQLR
jgi:hypothetical protein